MKSPWIRVRSKQRFAFARPSACFLKLACSVLACSLMILAASCPLCAQDDPPRGEPSDDVQPAVAEPEVNQASVRALLRELESSTLQARDAAEKSLVEMGPAVLPFLPEVTSRTSGEMKIRLQRIRQMMENVEVGDFFKATTVTLTGKLPLTEAIEKIAEATGNAIQLQGEDAFSGVEVELDAADQPFWETLSSVMRQANLRVNAYGTTEGDLVLAPGGNYADSPAPFQDGPFFATVSSVQSTLPFNSALGGQLQVSLQVTWEPRLKPVFMQIPMSGVSAELEGGETLSASNPQAAPEIPLNFGGCSTQIDLQLQRPARNVTAIKKLSGEFLIAVPSERHQYEFTKFGNGARQSEKFGDVTVVLENCRRNGSVYEVRILVEFGNSQGALDSFRGWIMSNEAYLLDPRERRLENVGLQTYAVTGNSVGIAYLFQINGDPDDYKLVYESPAVITKQAVTYELLDIELP